MIKELYVNGIKYVPENVELLSNKDWEIVEFKHGGSEPYFQLEANGQFSCSKFNGEYFTLDDLLHNKLGKTYLIHSVRRLSDGEVFSVGDKIEGFGDTPIITISKFNIDTFDNSKISAYHKNGYGKGSAAWKKINLPLFQTFDGVAIYEGDSYWCVYNFRISNRYTAEKNCLFGDKSEVKYFSTEDVAETFVLMNKPFEITLQSVKDFLFNYSGSKNEGTLLYEEFKKLSKSKLKQ